MRPYLAIIVDSFREALVSRILWILLILSTLLLLAFAPIAVREVVQTRITMNTIVNHDLLYQELRGDKPLVQHIRRKFSPEFQLVLSEKVDDNGIVGAIKIRALADELSSLLPHPDLYDQTAWEGVKLDKETEQLLDQGVRDLELQELQQLNRRLLEAAFPENLPIPEAKMCRLGYFKFFLPPMPTSKADALNQLMVGLINLFVGFFAVLLAVLFTATMVPRTFEAGSIDMLLSKPVSRSLVFLARFAGGCSFITVIGAYLIAGIWLIAGIRLGFWSARLLLCIPVFVFNFVIFHSVSSLIGVIWRHAVVSIFLTIFFWVTCFSVGQARNKVREIFFIPANSVGLAQSGEQTFSINVKGQVSRWSAPDREWTHISGGLGGPMGPMGMLSVRNVGPVYDKKGKRILHFRVFQPNLSVASAKSEWQEEIGAAMPPAASHMFVHPNGEVYVVSGQYVSQLVRGQSIKEDKFVSVSPALGLGFEVSVSACPVSGDIAVFGRKRLVLMSLQDGRYRVKKTAEVSHEKALVALTNSEVILLPAKGKAQIYDHRLEFVRDLKVSDRGAARSAVVSPDGKSALILLHSEDLYVYDGKEIREAPVRNQGSVTAATYSDNGILVASDLTRKDLYSLDFKHKRQYAAKMEKLEKVYRFGIDPLYALFPKPSELGNLSVYFVTGEKTAGLSKDQEAYRLKRNIWAPLWSCLVFTVVMLVMSCAYVSRRDY